MKKNKELLVFFHRFEIMIASGAILLLVVILTFVLLMPNLDRANQIYAQEQTLKKKVETLKQKDTTLSSIDYQYYKDVFLKSAQILPESRDYVSLMNTFDYLERQSGITVVRTDFQLGLVSTPSAVLKSANGVSTNTVPITIEVMGDLGGISKFLEAVKDLNGRLIVFDDISVSKSQGTVLDATFNGNAFFYVLPTTLGPVESPLPRLEKNQEAILAKIGQLNLPLDTSVDLDKNSVGKKDLFK